MKPKRVTRRQACAWLAPMRKCFVEMQAGFSPAARGYPVTRLNERDNWVRTDYCIAGFAGLIHRLFPDLDLSPLERVRKRLAAGVLVSQADLQECLRLLGQTENRLITVTVPALRSAVRTEEIAIELEAAHVLE